MSPCCILPLNYVWRERYSVSKNLIIIVGSLLAAALLPEATTQNVLGIITLLI